MSDTPRTDAAAYRALDGETVAPIRLARELERDLAAMQKARDYEKTAHATATKGLRERIAELTGQPRQPGWEDDWLAKQQSPAVPSVATTLSQAVENVRPTVESEAGATTHYPPLKG